MFLYIFVAIVSCFIGYVTNWIVEWRRELGFVEECKKMIMESSVEWHEKGWNDCKAYFHIGNPQAPPDEFSMGRYRNRH